MDYNKYLDLRSKYANIRESMDRLRDRDRQMIQNPYVTDIVTTTKRIEILKDAGFPRLQVDNQTWDKKTVHVYLPVEECKDDRLAQGFANIYHQAENFQRKYAKCDEAIRDSYFVINCSIEKNGFNGLERIILNVPEEDRVPYEERLEYVRSEVKQQLAKYNTKKELKKVVESYLSMNIPNFERYYPKDDHNDDLKKSRKTAKKKSGSDPSLDF